MISYSINTDHQKMKLPYLLKSKRFLPLFVTQFMGAFNDNIFKNALVVLITYKITALWGQSPQTLVILAAGLFILPFFLFSVLAGQLADKYEKSNLIFFIKLVEIILMVLATYGFYSQNMVVLFFILFALGMHSTFFGPLKYAILPYHLREEELLAGNGLIEAGTFLSILAGTIFGGIFILHPYGNLIIAIIILFSAILGCIFSWFIPKTNHANADIKINLNFIKETYQLIAYSKKQKNIFLAILGISWFWFFGSIFLLEFPMLVKEVLHANENVITLFLTLFSVGLAIGSLLCNRLLKGKVHTTYVPLGVLTMSLFTLDLYFSVNHFPASNHSLIRLTTFLNIPQAWHICFDLLLIAMAAGIYTVPLYAALQKWGDKAHRARIVASNNVINALFMVSSSIFSMLLLSLGVSVIQLFLILGIINTIVTIYICKLLPNVILKEVFRCILTLLYRVEVKGLEHYEKAGERVIIIANHTSLIDALLLGTFLPHNFIFAVNTYTSKKWWTRCFTRLVDTYPVDPTNPMALKSLIELVQKNQRCVIFPEGRLTVTASLMKIYEGPGLIADKSNSQLLPIHIQGAQFTPFSRLRGKVPIRFMPKITITVFPPYRISVGANCKGRKRRQIISHEIYHLMIKTMFESKNDQQTLFQSLLHARALFGNQKIIIEDFNREPLTYKQFIKRCFILGNTISKTTMTEEHIGILLPNAISTMVLFFGLQAYARIPAMLNYSTGLNNLLSACQVAQIKTIYTSRQFILLAKLSDKIAALEATSIRIIYLEDMVERLNFIQKLKGVLMAQLPCLSYKWVHYHQFHGKSSDANRAAVILFTSGSEGTPKGVVLSHANIQANRHQLSSVIDFNPNDNVFNALPLFHSFGLTACTLLPLLSGVKIFLYPSPLHYRIIPELCYDTNATLLFGTDTFLAAYAKYAHPYDFYSIRYVFAGAERLREETRVFWLEKFGIRILEGYGATEASPVISINTPMQYKKGSVGCLLPGIRYQITPIPGIAAGGALTISGPNIMKGYLLSNQPGVLQPCLPHQGYDTGDIVSMDEQGFITIQGRIKRFAKIAGEMISLTMVEQSIQQLWPAHQHAVIAIPDSKKGEQLILVTNYSQATRDAVITFVKEHQFSEIAIPKKITILDKLPLLGTGKTDYLLLRKIILERFNQSPSPLPT